MTRQLVQYLSARTEIDAQTTAYVTGHFKPMVTKRNAFLLTPGEVCKHYYFVNKGYLRLFSVNDGAKKERVISPSRAVSALLCPA